MGAPTFVRGSWAAGKSPHRAFRSVPSGAGPNLANMGYLHTARSRARDAVRNVPLAARAVELDVTNIIGTGIVPRFDDDNLGALWLRWEDECDAHGARDIYGLQESGVRAWRESGEAFLRMRPRRSEDGLSVPLQVELLESDMLPLLDELAPSGNRIIQGVEFDSIGRRVAYWFHRQHPGEYGMFGADLGRYTRVPAEWVCHLHDSLRPGQVRGFPPLATVLQRMQQMSDYDEATIERQKQAAHFTAFFTRPSPEAAGIDPITGEAIGNREVSEVAPGSGYLLLPGEDVRFPDLPSLGGEYEAFHRVQARQIAAGFGVPYELLTGDFGNLSDRTARVIINEYRRRVEQHQWHRVVRQVMRPIWLQWIRAGRLAGTIPEGVSDAVRWVPPAWPYFHPVQDVESIREEIKAGLRSRSDAIHSRGNDPRQVLRERIADQETEQEAGLHSTTVNPEPKV